MLIREPGRSTDALLRLIEHAQRHIPRVILHDRHPAARGLPLPLHLPQGAQAPGDRIFGVSCHDARSLDEAFAQGAAWALLSPVYPPLSKPGDLRSTLGPARYLALAARRPVFALGGLDLHRSRALLDQGAYGIAAIHLFFSGTAAEAARRCEALLSPHRR